MGIVVVVPHWPLFGVNVYTVVVVLFNAGDHVPEIPFKDVVGNGDKGSPAQMAGTSVNTGIRLGFTTMVMVAVVAHCPVVGVKV
jgi:hypothetical protein